MTVLLQVLLKQLCFAMANLDGAHSFICPLQLDRAITDVLAIHLLPRLQKVFWVREGHETVLCLLREEHVSITEGSQSGKSKNLLTQTVTDDSGLGETSILLEGIGQNIIRDIV